MRILIVHDDVMVVHDLPARLRPEGHRVFVRAVGDLPAAVLAEGIHLVILEPALLPFGRVIDLCRTLRRHSATMLLLVSRQAGVAERIQALEAGADDYLATPFELDELVARLHSLLRRHPLNLAGEGAGLERLTETLWLDLAGQRLVGDSAVGSSGACAGERRLTDREFRLLAHLVRHEGAVLSREALL